MDDLEAMDAELSILKNQLKFQSNISISFIALRKLEEDIIATMVAKISPLCYYIALLIPKDINDVSCFMNVSSFQERLENYRESVRVLKQEVTELEADIDGVRNDMMTLNIKVYLLNTLLKPFNVMITESKELFIKSQTKAYTS